MMDRKNPMAAAVAIALLTLGGALVTGCNTVEGAGKDVESAGNAVQRASCDHNNTNNKDCTPPP